jgi:hypothetical protein
MDSINMDLLMDMTIETAAIITKYARSIENVQFWENAIKQDERLPDSLYESAKSEAEANYRWVWRKIIQIENALETMEKNGDMQASYLREQIKNISLEADSSTYAIYTLATMFRLLSVALSVPRENPQESDPQE